MIRILLVLAMAIFSQFALSSDWEVVSVGDNVVASIDKESIRFQGNTAKFWMKWEYSEPQEVLYSYPMKFYKMTKDLNLYNCINRTSATVQSIQYAELEGGSVINTFQIKISQAEFSEIAPDTMGETVLQWVCNRKPKLKK